MGIGSLQGDSLGMVGVEDDRMDLEEEGDDEKSKLAKLVFKKNFIRSHFTNE